MMRRWLLPLVLFALAAAGAWYATLVATPFVLMRAAAAKAGTGLRVNQFRHGPMTTATNQTIVRPSPDLAYSLCVFDVSKGPVVVEVQPVAGHYWSVSVFDARTDVAAVQSDRDTGGRPAKLWITRDGRKAPAGYTPVRVGYDRGVVLIRILLASPAEFPAVDAVRRRSVCAARS